VQKRFPPGTCAASLLLLVSQSLKHQQRQKIPGTRGTGATLQKNRKCCMSPTLDAKKIPVGYLCWIPAVVGVVKPKHQQRQSIKPIKKIKVKTTC
jgi:hypothetical protein